MAQTAEQLVRRARALFGDMGPDQYRDGFPDDPDTDADVISILEFINVAQRKLGEAGLKTQDVNIATMAGTMEYDLPNTVGRIIYAEYTDDDGIEVRLRPRTITELINNVGDYSTVPSATPGIYSTDIKDKLLVFRRPVVAGNVRLKCGATPTDMAAKTDTPDGIPDRLNDVLAFLGCFYLTISNSESDATTIRARSLLSVLGDYEEDLKDIVDARSILQSLPVPSG